MHSAQARSPTKKIAGLGCTKTQAKDKQTLPPTKLPEAETGKKPWKNRPVPFPLFFFQYRDISQVGNFFGGATGLSNATTWGGGGLPNPACWCKTCVFLKENKHFGEGPFLRGAVGPLSDLFPGGHLSEPLFFTAIWRGGLAERSARWVA